MAETKAYQEIPFSGLSNSETRLWFPPDSSHRPVVDYPCATYTNPIYQHQTVHFSHRQHYHFKCGTPACYTLHSPFYHDRCCNSSLQVGLRPFFTNTKPSLSYVGLISEAILNSPEKKVLLSDIYDSLLVNYPYFRTRTTGWRNSIRHNLSLNPCFIKAGKSANGKGHYWSIHPDYIQDFQEGKFKKRLAKNSLKVNRAEKKAETSNYSTKTDPNSKSETATYNNDTLNNPLKQPVHGKEPEKRLFDIASLLSSQYGRNEHFGVL